MVEQKVFVIPHTEVLIFTDKREFNSQTVLELGKHDCTIKPKMLQVADFLCSDRVAIEKKTDKDFSASIIDKRIFTQLKDLKNNFEKPILLIEGNELYEKLHPNMIRGALAAIAIDFGIPIIWSRDAAESAGLIYWIARREQIDDKRTISLRGAKQPSKLSEQQEYLVSGLPGINIIRAQNLLSYFKKPISVFTATVEDLTKVKGMGEKTAQRMREVLDKEY